VITSEMDAITLKALEKDPQNRYQSAKEMRDDITRLLAGLSPTAQLPTVAAPEAAVAATALAPVVGAVISPSTAVPPQRALPASPGSPQWEPRRGRSRTGLVIGIIAAILAVALIVAFAFWWNKTPAVAQVAVPQVLSMTEKNATDTLTSAKLHAVVKSFEGPDDTTKNTVIEQDPKQGVRVDQGSDVTITINVGPAKMKIPAGLIGQKKDAVQAALTQAGFTKVTLAAATSEPPTSVKDNVVSINPAEGAEVAQDTPITVTYATGQSAFPDLSGFAQAAAVLSAKAAGFSNVSVKERVPTAAESLNGTPAVGTVIETDPKAGTVADRTTPVTIYVALPSSPPSSSATSTATSTSTATATATKS